MQHKQLEFSIVLLLALGMTGLHAQENINATGSNASGSGGSVSYSVGQIVYQTNSGTNGSVAEGVQQPYEILVVTGIEESKGINLSITAFPNPTNDYLTLEVKDTEFSTLHFQLYNMYGKLLQNVRTAGNQTNIVMRNLVPATYFVKVIQENKEIKIFKVIKK